MANNVKNTTSSLAPGTVLHGAAYTYKITQTLGQGTFGITYLAEASENGSADGGGITTYVTLKEFFMSKINGRRGTEVTASDDGGYFDYYKKRFIKEAQNLKSLHHDGIVKVAEAFERNNTAYYAMEYIDGETLAQYTSRRGSVDERKAVALTLEIADALAYMHSRNMLHLDIKPSNVMLRDGHAVLIDFGLSKQYDDKGEPESSTSVGLGTPGYAPIEQANYHEHGGLPATLDIYALGATMMKMLTGIALMPTASELLNDGFPVGLFRQKGVSAQLTAIVEKAMSPLKKDRYQTMDELKAALTALTSARTDDEPTMFEPHGSSRKAAPKAAAKAGRGPAKAATDDTAARHDNGGAAASHGPLVYKKMKGLVWLVAEWLLAFVMLAMSRDPDPDTDGTQLMFLYPVICVAVLWWLVKNRKKAPSGLWKKLRWGITALAIANALMLPEWNGSLTASYFFLAVFIAPVSAYLIMVRKDDGNGRYV